MLHCNYHCNHITVEQCIIKKLLTYNSDDNNYSLLDPNLATTYVI